MGLELVLEGAAGQKVRTNPSRDIAHFWPDIVRMVRPSLIRDMWDPWFRDYLNHYPVTEEQLLLAATCLERALWLALDPTLATPDQAIQASGFTRTPLPAQLVVIAKLGQLTYGAFWAGIKSANPLGEDLSNLLSFELGAQSMLGALRKNWASPGGWPQGVGA